MTQKKNAPSFVRVDTTQLDPTIAKLLASPPVPTRLAGLFADHALNQIAEAFAELDKPAAITKAEITFPGPFMRVVTKLRSFYFRWDENNARAVEIDRQQFPRATAISRSVTISPANKQPLDIEAARQMLLGRFPAEATQ